jgi:anti-sigma factor RsiW
MTEQDEMRCRELVEVVTDYVEGTLPERDRIRFDAHLGACPFCETYLDQMRDTIARLGQLRAESLSAETREGLLAAFRGRRGTA